MKSILGYTLIFLVGLDRGQTSNSPNESTHWSKNQYISVQRYKCGVKTRKFTPLDPNDGVKNCKFSILDRDSGV